MTLITKETQNLLRTFSTINKSIVIKPGNILSTLSVNKNILAKAEIEETFSKEMAIYDLSAFCEILRLYDGLSDTLPQIEQKDNHVLISNPNAESKVKYFYSDPDIIVQPPDKEVDLPSEDLKFRLSLESLKQVWRVYDITKAPDLCVYGKDGQINLCVTDKKNDSYNTFTLKVGETDEEFCYCMKMENLKVTAQGYDVTISKHNVARFTADNIKFLIALEPNN